MQITLVNYLEMKIYTQYTSLNALNTTKTTPYSHLSLSLFKVEKILYTTG